MLNSMRLVVLDRHQKNVHELLYGRRDVDISELGPALKALGEGTALILARLQQPQPQQQRQQQQALFVAAGPKGAQASSETAPRKP